MNEERFNYLLSLLSVKFERYREEINTSLRGHQLTKQQSETLSNMLMGSTFMSAQIQHTIDISVLPENAPPPRHRPYAGIAEAVSTKLLRMAEEARLEKDATILDRGGNEDTIGIDPV